MILDGSSEELVEVGLDGRVRQRLFTRMPAGAMAAHRDALAVVPAQGDEHTVLWLLADDGTVRQLALAGFAPGRPLAADPLRRRVATTDPDGNRIVVADIPLDTDFDS